MTGFELAVGYLIGWGWRKARHAGHQADAAVDTTVDTLIDRLRDLVVSKLGADPALAALDREAAAGADAPRVSDRSQRRVRDALEAAAEDDPDFGAELLQLVERVRQAGGESASVIGTHGTAITGGVSLHGQSGAVVALNIQGAVSTGGTSHPQVPGTEQA